MKKLLNAFAIVAVLTMAAPAQKAEAGIVTLIGTYDNMGEGGSSVPGFLIGGSMAVAGGALFLASLPPDSILGIFAGAFLFGLDGKAFAADSVERSLGMYYSFIDDRELISELATLIRTRLKTAGALTRSMEVHFSAEEVRAIFAGSSLSSEQIERVVADMK